MNVSPRQARKLSLSRMVALPVFVALVAASSWQAEAKPVFKKVERGDCECWCKTSAGTYTHVEFGITRKACSAIQAKSCKDGQGNPGTMHGCAYTTPSDSDVGALGDAGGVDVLQSLPRVVPQGLPAMMLQE